MASRSKSKTTTDHDEIRRWAEARGGRPAVVKSTRGKGDDTGILRIDFPGYSGAGSLEEISWEEFFDKFDREGLALVYQETTASGQKSNFNKIVSHESVMGRAAARAGGAGKSGGGARKTARKRSGAAAKKAARKTTDETKGSAARKRSSARKTSPRKSTGRKAAKRGSGSR